MYVLVHTIEEPVIPQPDATNLGITDRWLQEHVEEAGRYALYFNYQAGSVEQKMLFRNAFTDLETIQRKLKDVYDGFHTDDYPKLVATVRFSNGTITIVTSDSQNPFMIPWQIGALQIYNAHISLALRELLPNGFINRERLTSGDQFAMGLLPELAQRTAREIKARWLTIGPQGNSPAKKGH